MGTELSTIEPTFFDSRLDEIRKILPPDTITAEALARVIITAINKNPKLRQCSEVSILECLMDIASVGLMPNTPHGFAYLIPYKIDGVPTATLQIGYKGFCEIAYRSDNVKVIQGDVVRDGDEFSYAKGANIQQFVRHVKSLVRGRKDREILAAWNSVELINGGVAIEVMEADELEKIKRMAKRKEEETPAWKYFEDEMYKKTVVKRNLKLLQIGNMETIQRAIEIDNRATVIPGIDVPAKKEHNLVITDEPKEGEQILEMVDKGNVKEGNGQVVKHDEPIKEGEW